MRRRTLIARLLGAVVSLPRRAWLTVVHLGWRTLGFRILTSPLRLLNLERRAERWRDARRDLRAARAWFRRAGLSVLVVVPTYGPPARTLECVGRLRRVLPRRARVVVVDDGSPEPDRERLRSALLDTAGVELVLAEANRGYAAAVNLGLERAGPDDDVVVMNNDVLARRGAIERLARTAHDEGGLAGPKLLYPDGRIQSAGSFRNVGDRDWFDHRYRFKQRWYGPATVRAPALAMTGACIYVTRAALSAIGPMDAGYPMGFEDVDWCLRAWDSGHAVSYEPGAAMTHLESVTRGTERGERELASLRHFWSRWGARFDERPVTTAAGALRVIYVTEGTGVGGGHRDVFEHLDRLAARGHEVELYSLEGPPDWYPLRAPVRAFDSYAELTAALAEQDAIKVATWWKTAWPVWRASVRRGVPVYFVQDIETSYYAGTSPMRDRVLATYREEFNYLTISSWNRDRLRELGLDAELLPPGIDLDTFHPLELPRRTDVVLAIGRANPLKDLPLTLRAWRGMRPRPELWMFGVEPETAPRRGARYVERPTDAQVNELFATAGAFVQTSRHEGFCLPLLEAMASGTPVVSTDAHGNRDFCRDGENCVLTGRSPRSVRAGIERVLSDPELARRLGEAGKRTAAEYAWERRIDQLERYLERLAGATAPRRSAAPRG